MELLYLNIYSETLKENIRHVEFNKNGLSLIVDNDNSVSGSTIGKTTFVRCVDLCLGSDTHKNIYKDKETSTNIEVENELKSKKMYVMLGIKRDDEKIVLKRALFQTNDQYIDGELFENIKEYRAELKKRLFPDAPSSISFRQIISKFVRLGVNGESIFKYQEGQGKNQDYQNVYKLFFDMCKSEIILNKKNKLLEIENIKNSLNKKYHIRKLENFKKVLNSKQKEYLEKEQMFKSIQYVDDFKKIDENNFELTEKLDDLANEIYEIEHKVKVLKNRIEREQEKVFECDNDVLVSLYSDIKGNFPHISKSYDEFVKFHNNMCNIRLNLYIEEKIELEILLNVKKQKLINARKDYVKNFIEFKTSINSRSDSLFSDYYNCKIECKNIEYDYNLYVNILNEIITLNKEIATLEENIDLIDNRKKLNSIFERVSSEVLDSKYSFEFDDDEKKMPISSNNIKGRIGSSQKKTLVCAVDFAFNEFFVERNLEFPRFIIHDKMELASNIELKRVFDYCRTHNLQYIVPIMRDKLEHLNVKDEEIILRLSKKDKLFRF